MGLLEMYQSEVTINHKMYIKKADDSFLKYTGLGMSASITGAIYQEDWERFQCAIKDLELPGIPQNMIFLRLRNAEGGYSWATINMQYESYEIKGQTLIHLTVSEWEKVKEQKEKYDAKVLQMQAISHEDYERRLMKEIREDASFDEIRDKDAGLDILNKRAITEYAHKVIERKTNKCNYFIIFDMDHFKAVNDSYGHMFGDEVLATVTGIIKNIVNNRGLIGRIGGDEILIVTNSIEDRSELKNVLRSIRTTVEWTYKGKYPGVSITCSMGVAAFPKDGSTYEEVFELADRMLYLAKNKGRNRYVIFTPELHEKYLENVQAEKNSVAISQTDGNRLTVMQQLIEDYLVRHSTNNEMLFAQIGEAFNIDEILLIYHNKSVSFRWTREEAHADLHEIDWMTPDKEFYECFDENSLFLVHGMYVIEENLPDRKEIFEQHAIRAAMFYQLKREGENDGFVMFSRKEQRGKWSEYEVLAFTVIAKVFEMSIR